MTERLFREGGPHNIRRTGPDLYTMQIKLPTDAMSMTARKCTDQMCSPGAFKVKCGTGITTGQQEAYCPYCRTTADPNDFVTRDQISYAKDIATNEATAGAERMLARALGLASYRGQRPPVRRLWEEQLRRDVSCPHCTLEHAVCGLAVWCPDCGKDIFVTHVETESQVVRAMLNDVNRRHKELGPRVAARDIENGLEDVVSIFEAALKAMMRRRLVGNGVLAVDLDEIMTKKVRNRFQGYDGAVETLAQLLIFDLTPAIPAPAVERFKRTLEKRHPITHNLGIVDRKYLEKVRSGEAEGRDVTLDEQEVIEALDTALLLITYVHRGLFP